MSDNHSSYHQRDKEFLGTGLACPLQLSPARRLRLAGGDEDIQQAIRIILGTAPGERLMRPEFGCRVHELLFAPYDIATEALIIHYVKEALARWEPRVTVEKVTVDVSDAGGRLIVTIFYSIKPTHDERSIVYPFYLMGEE